MDVASQTVSVLRGFLATYEHGVHDRQFAKRVASESDRPGLAMIKDALGLPGGLPIKVGNETIGGVGVAGAPGGNGDVACAEAAIEAVRDQLK